MMFIRTKNGKVGSNPILPGSFICLIFVSLIKSSLACVAAELVQIKNGGVINDFLTP